MNDRQPDRPNLPAALDPLATDVANLHTLHDAAAVHLRLQAIDDVVAEAIVAVRNRTQDLAFADAGGSGLTRRLSGYGQVIVTDPTWRPRIVDEAAFEAWAVDETDLEHSVRRRVTVTDHEAAGDALDVLAADATGPEALGRIDVDADALRALLAAVSRLDDEVVLAEKPLDKLTKAKRVRATEDGLVDTESGELVPGVETVRAEPSLQLRPDVEERRGLADEVRANLGRGGRP